MPERVINNNFKSVFKFKTYASNSFRQLETDFFIIKNKMKEVFKDIPNYEGLYQVSNYGRVKSLERKVNHLKGLLALNEKILKGGINSKGYHTVCLYKNGIKKTYSPHRLVALVFILNPKNKKTVNHINGIKTDNNINNLEWNTNQENIQHAWKTGLSKGVRGEKQHIAKLTEKEILQIRDLAKCKRFNLREIGEFYNCNRSNICHIINLKTWRHV